MRATHTMGSGTILLGPLPPLLGELVSRLVEPSRVVPATLGSAPRALVDALLDAAVCASASLVIVALASDDDARRLSEALDAQVPGAAVVDLDARGRRAARWERGHVAIRLADPSPDALRALVLGVKAGA
jgi:hypothetical protein